MQAVIQECNFIIIVINDILSLKKEIVSNPPANILNQRLTFWRLRTA